MSDSKFDDTEMTLDLADIIRVIRKRVRLMVCIFLIAVFVAGVISFLIPPTYEAETTLRIKQPKDLADSLLADVPIGNTLVTQQLMSTYAEILKSRTVVEDMIVKTQSGKSKKVRYEDMLDRITTEPVKDTEILKIKVQAGSPKEAKSGTNTLVDCFLARLTTLVRSEDAAVGDFIGERLIEAKQDLDRAEDALEQFKRQQQIVAPEAETQALVDNLSKLNELKAENTVNLAASRARLESAQKQISQEKGEFIADSPLIEQYKAKLADLEVELVSLLPNYTDKHPKVIATRAEIEETRNKLNTEIARVINAETPSMNPIYQGLLQGKIQAEVEIAAANAQTAALNKITTEGEEDLTKLPAKEQDLARLMRDDSLAQDIYVMLAKRREEAKISEVMQPTDVQIVDRAVLPDKPIKPNKRMNILMGAFLGLLAGSGLAFALEYLYKTINNGDDIDYYLDLPVLGNIPDFEQSAAMDQRRLRKQIGKLIPKNEKEEKA